MSRSSPNRQTAVLANSSRLSMRRSARATLVTMSPSVQANSHLGSAAFSAPAKCQPAGGSLGLTVEVVAHDSDQTAVDLDVSQLRVFLVQDESTGWSEQLADGLGPAVDVRDPDERAAAGVDDVEGLAGECPWTAADVGGQEVGGDAGGFGLAVGHIDLSGADVDAGDLSAGVGPRQRFLAASALQVAKTLAAHVAGGSEFVLAQQRSAPGEEVGGRPDFLPEVGNRVPGVAVGSGVLVHGNVSAILGVGLERLCRVRLCTAACRAGPCANRPSFGVTRTGVGLDGVALAGEARLKRCVGC